MPANRYRYPAAEGIPRQSERTASENKERAYIAASRRSDRSLEARVQSAFAASQIHKERTGKALKVTEEIVLKEEMYEEEDDLPARYHALMNNPLFALSPRASAYAITQMGMRDAVASRLSNGDPSRLDEVNRQFAQVFPGFGTPLQQTSLCEPTATHSPAGPGPHTPFPQPTQAQGTSPYSPVTQTQQPGVHQASPQNMAFRSPSGSPASQGDTPISASSIMRGHTLSSMHARSMSMSQVEPALMYAQQRATTISPVLAAQISQHAGQRRSYDEAFSNTHSPLMTPTFSGVYPPGTGLQSPGMPPPAGLPATYNSNMQRRATVHPIAMSPGEMHPVHAAGFTTQLPANVQHFLQSQHEDRPASFSGTPQYFLTPPHSNAPTTHGAKIVSHTTHAQFKLHGNLRQMQREKKERKRRTSQETQGAIKGKKAVEANTKAKDATEPTPQLNAETATVADHRKVMNEPTGLEEANSRQSKNALPDTDSLAVYSQHQEEQVVKPDLMDVQAGFATGNVTHNFGDISFDVSSFQGFNSDFPLETFNMNFDDSFDMNQFFTFPASQPENDNAQAVS
ncbi:hypothetical protein VSDG_03535 [Cytospora chrysosperma]|uniref:Uncharacterized protein n=1 Tax=Cytospora chrysosperma TaxID=252740 RepID=A0A423W9S6_CYTCH|nr:hypothetical protein VSDG_03535 [Valsa sordida]